MSMNFIFFSPSHPLFAFACYRACDSVEHTSIQTLAGAGNPRVPFLYRMPGLPLHRLWKGFSNLRVCWNHLCVGVSLSSVCDSLRCYGLQPARLLCPWSFPGKNTGMGCHSLLSGIFPTQGLNQGLLHFRQILYHLSHQGNTLLRTHPKAYD